MFSFRELAPPHVLCLLHRCWGTAGEKEKFKPGGGCHSFVPFRLGILLHEWLDGWMAGWLDGWMTTLANLEHWENSSRLIWYFGPPEPVSGHGAGLKYTTAPTAQLAECGLADDVITI